MKLSELKENLAKHPDANVRFVLPNGVAIPAHAHVTEVARIDKRFVDCGGTLRNESLCRLQTWLAENDKDHRLTAGKFLKIFEKAIPVLRSEDLDVDIEYEVGVISQFPLGSIEVSQGAVILCLNERHTACLAPDKCKPSPVSKPVNFKGKKASSGCCS